MKYSDLTLQPRLLRKPDAEIYVGGRPNLDALRKAEWIKPLIQHNCNTTFDRHDLDRAQLEGWPGA